MNQMPEPVLRTRWTAVIALGLAIVMVWVDMTVVATALPVITAYFHADPGLTQWVVLAYSLPMIALTIPAGRWIDGVNLRYAFTLAVVGFALASALAGIAPTFEVLLAARGLQGVFAALSSALLLAVAAAVVNPNERGRAMGLISTVGPIGSIAGPGLGGLLIASVGWRWVFYINLPVCVLAFLIGWLAIPSNGRLARLRPSLVLEAALTGAAVLGLIVAMNNAASDGWASPRTALPLLLAAAFVAIWLRRPSTAPVLGALRERALASQLSVLVLYAASNGATLFLVPFLLQNVLGLSPSEAGAVLLVTPLAIALAAQVGGRASDRFGPPPTMAVGFTLITGAAPLLLPLDPSWGSLDVAWRMALIGLGCGFIGAPINSAIMAATPRGLMGTVSGLSGVARPLGFALGPAVGTILWIGRDFTPESMRPSFALLVILPALALIAVLATSRRTRPPSAVKVPPNFAREGQPAKVPV